ncbi:gp53-like domain-containing protein [Ralstonia syzygii subsp. celebesensis]
MTFFVYSASYLPVIAASGTDVIGAGAGTAASLAIKSTGYVTFVSEGVGTWEAHGTAMLDQLTCFSSVIGMAGYQKLPSGVILQWGTAATAANTDVTQTLPLTYPNQQLHVFVTGDYTVGTGAQAYYNAATNGSRSSFICRATASIGARFLSIGW